LIGEKEGEDISYGEKELDMLDMMDQRRRRIIMLNALRERERAKGGKK
jgi:hypothetical protein